MDAAVMDLLRAAAAPWLTRAMWVATLAGDTFVATTHTVLAGLVLILRGRWRRGVVLVASVASATAVSEAVKALTDRARPPAAGALIEMPSNASFPSGHALATIVLYVGFALLVTADAEKVRSRVLAVGAATLAAAAVGVSRVYLGVHWPSDVVGSWAIGAATVALALLVARTWDREGAATGGLGWSRAAGALTFAAAVAALAVEMWRHPLP